MFVLLAALNIVSLLASTATCMTSNGRKGYGLIGYGITMYKPNCAQACRAAISSSTLNCSIVMDDMEGMDMGGMHMTETDVECYATDDAYLQTVAYCVYVKCPGLKDSDNEKWWYANVVGRDQGQPDPKESYRQTLDRIASPPTEEMVSGNPLNQTMLVDEFAYLSNWNAQDQFEEQEELHERYSIVIVVSCLIAPIAFSLARFVPFPGYLVTRFNSWIIEPPLWGSQHKQPLAGGLGIVPTRGQALFIAYIVGINIILSAAGYRAEQPNAWWPDDNAGIIKANLANRVGVLSFANLPLLMLYSSRNNFLFQVTDWSCSTFLLLHRWVAGVATIQAALHSILYLRIYIETASHATQSKLPYWYWGIIATLSMSILLPCSVLYIRQKLYEIFLALHVFLSIMTVVGCYYHIIFRFQHQWGYETWIYTTMAVWSFDRVMRLLKIARNGIRTAVITKVDEDYVRIDVPGVVASGHVYLYFPTLTWRVWENHPFSVASTITPQPKTGRAKSVDEESATGTKHEIQVSTTATSEKSSDTHRRPPKLGLTFFLRRQAGLTHSLGARASLPVLVESSYNTHIDTSENPHLVYIIGGIGITSALPYLRSHPGSSKLYWGVRSEGIVHALDDEVLQRTDKEIFVGHRMNVREVLQEEIAFAGTQGVTVLVSGPGSMTDEARVAVTEFGRIGKVNVKLIDVGFSW